MTTPRGALGRLATTGIYMVRDVPRDVQRAARDRAARQGTTLHRVLLQGLREYAAGTWAPQLDDGAGGSSRRDATRTRR
jgi:hypothetical protein